MHSYIGVLLFILGMLIGMILMYRVKKKSKPAGTLYATESIKGRILYTLELNEDPEDLLTKTNVTFRVVPPHE